MFDKKDNEPINYFNATVFGAVNGGMSSAISAIVITGVGHFGISCTGVAGATVKITATMISTGVTSVVKLTAKIVFGTK